MNGMLEHSCGAMGVGMMKSAIELERVRMVFFARIQFEKRMRFCIYCGTLVYSNLIDDKDLDTMYREGVMFVNVKESPDVRCTYQKWCKGQ